MDIEKKIIKFMCLAVEQGSVEFFYYCSSRSFEIYFRLINASTQCQIYTIYIDLSNDFICEYQEDCPKSFDVKNFLNTSLIFYIRLFESDDYNFLVYCFNFFKYQEEEENFRDLRSLEILVQELRKEYKKRK